MLPTSVAERQKLKELSNLRAHDLVFQFLQANEKDSEKWWEQEGSKLADSERAEVLENLQVDEAIYSGGIKRGIGFKESAGERIYAAADASFQLDAFLEAEGLDCPKDSPAYNKLQSLFHMAVIENIQRDMDRLEYRGAQVHQPLFKEVFAHSAPAKTSIALGELLKEYRKTLVNKAESTKTSYRTVERLVSEVFGDNKQVDEISKADAENFLSLLEQIPLNATKIYRGKTLEEAIKIADLNGKKKRLAPKSLKNYHTNIIALFNFAVEEEYMRKNPFRSKYLRQAFARDEEREIPSPFSSEQLNKLFRAPLYTGCKDDEKGYAKAGTNQPRRGRFWVPLLALFHGLRCNEAAQLYTEDVGESGGRSAERQYDHPTMKRLLSQIEAVKYEELNLSHLYRPNSNEGQ
jgi:integrase